MAITKSIVELMGGTIEVSSEVDKGTIFVVSLELRIPQEQADWQFLKERGITHILLVGADEECIKNVRALIQGDIGLTTVDDTLKAITLIKEDKEGCPLVLTDWEACGLSAVREIREEFNKMPILLLAKYEAEGTEEALLLGHMAVLTKPFFVSALKESVVGLWAQPDGSKKEEAPREVSGFKGLRFLAAEDNEINAEILGELLEIEGAYCEIVENGKLAVERFEQSDTTFFSTSISSGFGTWAFIPASSAALSSSAKAFAVMAIIKNLLPGDKQKERFVNLFSPMEKIDPDAENVARSASDLTVMMAEEQLGVTVGYMTYTAEDYQDKTYDDVVLERARNNMDDIYLLNPDTLLALGAEGKLMDLSGLECAENLRDIIRVANTVDGKLVAIPQEVVAYGLFVNVDMFRQYGLELPKTPEEFLECCRVFKENGIETPIGANRWWLENFVFAISYADLYNGGNTEAEIEALNSGEAKYSDYMRPGFEFLKKLIDLGYIDKEKAIVSEAIEPKPVIGITGI